MTEFAGVATLRTVFPTPLPLARAFEARAYTRSLPRTPFPGHRFGHTSPRPPV